MLLKAFNPMRYLSLAAVALVLSHAGPALAWSAAGCGVEPSPPAVQGGSVERYNASIDRVGAYDNAARAFSACVGKASLAEQTAISNDARQRMNAVNAVALGVQRRIGSNFTALSAQLRSAGQKLGSRR